VAAVAVLLAVTAIGLRARGLLPHASNQTAAGASGTVLAIALSAAEGLAVIAFLVVLAAARPQRQPKPGEEDDEERWRPKIPWYAKTLLVLLAVAALVTPFAVLFTRKPRHLGPRPLPSGVPQGQLGHAATSSGSEIWPLITGMVIAVAVVVAFTLWARKRRAEPKDTKNRTRLTVLLDSLAAGRDALTAGGEPRAAIIACYAAMERGFAAAGSAPAVADTPAEVLARATRAGLVRPEPAETLTGLFRRARYSTYAMTSADSRAADDALTALRADLGESASQEGKP
jgi:heme/copper-type cytochrome/quinol oxidase subunit 2